MGIQISDPLFLLSAQTGLAAGELKAKAADGNPDIEKPQEALQTGEPIPIIFCRRRNSNGGVMVQPKITEAQFANPIIEEEFQNGSSTDYESHQTLQLKFLYVVSEGELPQIQIRDLFYGNSRRGTFNQAYDGRAGSWTPGNLIDTHYDIVIDPEPAGYYNVAAAFSMTSGQSARAGGRVYYKQSDGVLYSFAYVENSAPTFCGNSGSYDELTTLSLELTLNYYKADKEYKSLNAYIRKGLQVTRLKDGVTGPSDNFADLVKYLFQKNDRLPDSLIDNTALTTAAKFVDANGFLFNGQLKESQNLVDWLQATCANFLLRVTNTQGQFGLKPRLPYNTDFTIKDTQITPSFTFTEEHVAVDGFEIEYISLEDRSPVCFVVYWRQQPEADFGLVRTVQVRNSGEAASGPFVDIDMSNYCTNEDHAVKIGAYRCAQRKHVDHHLRLTVRERSYNATLTVGDIVRVRLLRETNKGERTYHDYAYEINRIEKTFSSFIVYDLTHFPLDSQGRSIVARQVNGSSGAGNTINVGRSAFNDDENSSSSTTTVGTTSGGGGTNQPSAGDTVVDADEPLDSDGSASGDSSFPAGADNPVDSLDVTPQIEGYSGSNAQAGDTLTYAPGCASALIKWYKININTNARTQIASGVGATLTISEALAQEGVRVYAEGYCPTDSGYGPAITSNTVDVFQEIANCPGGGASGGQGTHTKVINVGSAYPASFTFTYTAYTIQDRFVISGAATYDTGYVSGENVSVTVQKTSPSPYITVTVYAPDEGTFWEYSVGCAG